MCILFNRKDSRLNEAYQPLLLIIPEYIKEEKHTNSNDLNRHCMKAVIRITQSRFRISCCNYIFWQPVIREVITAKIKIKKQTVT